MHAHNTGASEYSHTASQHHTGRHRSARQSAVQMQASQRHQQGMTAMDCLCEPSLRHNPFLCNATFLTAARLCGFQPPAAFMTRGARTSSVTPSTGLLSSPTDGCANETVLSVHDEKPRPTSGQPRLVVVHGKDAQSNPSEPPRREDEQLSRETWSSQTKLSEWLAGYMPPHRPHLPLEARVAMRAVLKKYIRSRFKSLRSSSSPSHQPWWKRLIDELLSKEHPRQQHLFWRQVLTIDSDHPVSRDQYAFRVAHHWLEARIESLVHARPNEKELSQSCEKELGLMCKDFGTLIGERNGVFEHFGATCLYFLTSMLLLPLSQLSLSWGKTSVAGDMPPPVWSDTPDDDDDADVDGELKKLKEVHQPPVFEDKPQRPTDVFTAWHDWHGRCTRRLLQEFLSQSLGYVFLTERIKLFFTPLWRRLLFSAFTFLSFAVVAFFPMAMQMDMWRPIGVLWGPWHGTSGVEAFYGVALLVVVGLLLAVQMSVVPGEDEKLEQCKYLDPTLLKHLKVSLLYAPKKDPSKPYLVRLSTRKLILFLVSQDELAKKSLGMYLLMVVAAVLVAITPNWVNSSFGLSFWGSCTDPSGCWPFGSAGIVAGKVVRTLYVAVLVYVMDNFLVLGSPFVWRKHNLRRRMVQLLDGRVTWWRLAHFLPTEAEVVSGELPRLSSLVCEQETEEGSYKLDLEDPSSILGFGIAVKVLESQDSTEQRRAQLTLAVFLLLLAVTTGVALVFQRLWGAVDVWILNWTAIELLLLIGLYIVNPILVRGIQINLIPARILLQLKDHDFKMSILAALVQPAERLRQPAEQQAGERQELLPATNRTRRWLFLNAHKEQPAQPNTDGEQVVKLSAALLAELQGNLSSVVYRQPFGLLGFPITSTMLGSITLALVSSVGSLLYTLAKAQL